MIFKDFQNPIKGLDFSKDGSVLVVYDEERLQIYDTINAKPLKTLFFKTKKINILKFTHHNNAVILVTKEAPYHLLYWSIFDNTIIKQFDGSENYPATHICVNPINDLVMVTFSDNTMKIYDISSDESSAIQVMEQNTNVLKLVAAFDNTGLVLVVGCYFKQKNK